MTPIDPNLEPLAPFFSMLSGLIGMPLVPLNPRLILYPFSPRSRLAVFRMCEARMRLGGVPCILGKRKMASDREGVEGLKRKIIELEKEISALKDKRRHKIDKMSDLVVDSNPYSRLMALKRMGIVDNYEVKYHVMLSSCMFVNL
jgi:hypothetical protein